MPDDINQQNTTSVDNSASQPVVNNPQTPPVEEKVEVATNENLQENPSNEVNQETTVDQNKIQSQVADELLNQDIFKVLKLENLSEEEKNNLKEKMQDTVMGRIMARIMDKLNVEDQKQFETLLNTDNNTEVEKFIDSKMNIKDIIAQETILYKAEMIDNAQKIDEMVKKTPADKSATEAPTTAIV